ncbi:UNKNOWN [Stylonychia lemnae]|uniref:Uncharacterized protein n=1 Tax=Stylonychia lemnae TaxID=5949 RepID=A0A078B8B1_STYLE|nr:UNKNOWN [Stylonychia lemnae]|eukprot:CDW90755.1 UNKNOWN [Stylonychia lemnae]
MQKKVVVINMADDDSSDDEMYNSSDTLRGQVRNSINIQFRREKSRNTSSSLSRTSSSIQRDAQIFQSLDNARPQNYKSGFKVRPLKKNMAQSIRVASQMSCESRLSQEIKEGLIRALDELNQDVRSLKAKIVDKKQKFRRVVKRIIHDFRIRRIRERYVDLCEEESNNFNKQLASIAIQRWFRMIMDRKKIPFRILKRTFKQKYNDGIYLGWKTRKIFRRPDIRSQILQIKYLQTQLMYGEQLCNSKTLLELKVKLINNIYHQLTPQSVIPKQEVDFITRQINVSDEVLQSIESNRFDNKQIYKYLSEFDNLLPPAEKRRSHLDDNLKPILDNYETFNRQKTQETAQFIKQQKEPFYEEGEYQNTTDNKKFNIQPISAFENFTDTNYNTLSTHNQQDLQDSTHQFCNLDYFRIDSSEMGILDIQNINFDCSVQESYNIVIENNNQLLDDTFSEKSEAVPVYFKNSNKSSNIHDQKLNKCKEEILNETFESNNNKSIDSTSSQVQQRRLQSLKKQYCKNTGTPIHSHNLLIQRQTPRVQNNYSPSKKSKAFEMKRGLMIQSSAGKNQIINIESKKLIQNNTSSPINFKSRKDQNEERKKKRKTTVDNLIKFYEELETQAHSQNDSFDEDQKEELQMKLEKMFIQLRGCFNDIVNTKK